MSGTLTPPSSINDVRTQAHLVIGERLADMPVQNVLNCIITNVPASVLPFLTWQFDVQSPFWQILSPGASQSQLIQDSIQLHRFHGTVFAIEQTLANMGFPDITLQEGQDSFGGTQFPADQGWAVFRVQVPINGGAISGTIQSLVEAAINFFKPQRCILDSVQWVNDLDDEIQGLIKDMIQSVAQGVISDVVFPTPSDIQHVPLFNPFVETKTISPVHDGHFYHSGFFYGVGNPAVVDSGITANGTPQA
jgi:phage tail P2-like protein